MSVPDWMIDATNMPKAQALMVAMARRRRCMWCSLSGTQVITIVVLKISIYKAGCSKK